MKTPAPNSMGLCPESRPHQQTWDAPGFPHWSRLHITSLIPISLVSTWLPENVTTSNKAFLFSPETKQVTFVTKTEGRKWGIIIGKTESKIKLRNGKIYNIEKLSPKDTTGALQQPNLSNSCSALQQWYTRLLCINPGKVPGKTLSFKHLNQHKATDKVGLKSPIKRDFLF